MSAVTVATLKAQLNIVGSADDELLADHLAAAQSYVEGYIGRTLASYAEQVPPANVPEALYQAIRMLAAFYYENREAVLASAVGGASAIELPLGVIDLLRPHRESWF